MNIQGMKYLQGVAAVAALGTACAGERPSTPDVPGQRIELNVAPLDLPGITEAIWAFTIVNGDGQVVVSRTDVRSTQFGDGKGAISYISPCDSTSNPHRITLDGVALFDADGPLSADSWVDPTPVALEVSCLENADVPVTFNLTIMRSAEQGFFDFAITFDQIQCSAKFDCDTQMLFDAEGNRTQTFVLGFTCASEDGTDLFLHFNDIQFVCDGGTTWFDPSGAEGNQGPLGSIFSQTGVYRGESYTSNPGVTGCYWNSAFAIIPGPDAANCSIVASATASTASWPDGLSPPDTTYPIVTWEIPLTDASGQVICSQHPLNGTPSGVGTAYTDMTQSRFTHESTCDGNITSNRQLLCGNINDGSGDMAVSFTEDDGLLVLGVGGASTAGFTLPPGHSLGAQCCNNDCCGP